MNGKIFSHAAVRAVSAVTPKQHMPLMAFADRFGEKEIERISNATGIKEVTVAEDGMTSSDYAYAAALRLFDEVGIAPEDIDGLIFLTESPDYIIPNTAAVLQHRLGLRTDTVNMDLRYGCAGFVYGLFQASLLVEGGHCKNVLLLAGDTISRFINLQDRSLRMVNGDAACAALITRSDSQIESCYSFFVDGSGKDSLFIPAGGARMPCCPGKTDVLLFDEDGNGRTQEDLYMNGMDIMVFAIRKVPKLIDELMEKIGWDKADVDLFALHQANKMIVNKIARTLKVPADKVPLSIEHTGNCGFDSIPLMLCNEYPGVSPNFRKVIACGFGAGLIAAAGALDLSRTQLIKTFEV